METITTYKKEIVSANLLDVYAGTNCPKGGDTGHGGRTLLRLEDQGSTDIRVKIDGNEVRINDSVEIVLGGDCEHYTFVETLEFALSVYKSQRLAAEHAAKSEHVE